MGNASHSSATKFNGSPQGTNICDHLCTWLNLTRLIYLFRIAPPKIFYYICIILQIGHINLPLIIIDQIEYFHSCLRSTTTEILIYISDNYFYSKTIVSSSGLAQSTQNIWNTLYSRRILCNPGLFEIIAIQDNTF